VSHSDGLPVIGERRAAGSMRAAAVLWLALLPACARAPRPVTESAEVDEAAYARATKALDACGPVREVLPEPSGKSDGVSFGGVWMPVPEDTASAQVGIGVIKFRVPGANIDIMPVPPSDRLPWQKAEVVARSLSMRQLSLARFLALGEAGRKAYLAQALMRASLPFQGEVSIARVGPQTFLWGRCGNGYLGFVYSASGMARLYVSAVPDSDGWDARLYEAVIVSVRLEEAGPLDLARMLSEGEKALAAALGKDRVTVKRSEPARSK
jgi:hypothetical protein